MKTKILLARKDGKPMVWFPVDCIFDYNLLHKIKLVVHKRMTKNGTPTKKREYNVSEYTSGLLIDNMRHVTVEAAVKSSINIMSMFSIEYILETRHKHPILNVL